MAARILMADGRDFVVAATGKQVADALTAAVATGAPSARLTTAGGVRVWINPRQVAAIEDVTPAAAA